MTKIKAEIEQLKIRVERLEALHSKLEIKETISKANLVGIILLVILNLLYSRLPPEMLDFLGQ